MLKEENKSEVFGQEDTGLEDEMISKEWRRLDIMIMVTDKANTYKVIKQENCCNEYGSLW